MHQLPLHAQHRHVGAHFNDLTGWDIPGHYGETAKEYDAVRKTVGIADLSHRGSLRVTGPDRVTWLQSIMSNDILPLTSGAGLYSSVLSAKGKMLTYVRVYAFDDALVLEDVGEIGDTTFKILRKYLLYGTNAKMENCEDSWGLLLLSGPQAPELLKRALDIEVPGSKLFSCVMKEIFGQQAFCALTEETGEIDLEIFAPVSILPDLWERLWDAGRPLGLMPFGTDTREVLRLEAGLSRAGSDLTEKIAPPEANLEGVAFSLSKGCYPGQEVVARMDTYGNVRRRLVGLHIEHPTPPPAGSKLFSGDREVGWISSAVSSPHAGGPIAFGFPLRDFISPGTELTVEMDGQRPNAIVQALPFYKRQD